MKEQVKFDKIIEVKNVTKVFDDETVLDDINLSIRRGQFVTLLGPSGCGKTTLLRMIAGFITPTNGEIFIENMPITGVPPYKRPVNTVFQKYALFPHLNVFKNVAYGLKLKKIEDTEAEATYIAKETERIEKKWQADIASVAEENKKRAAAGEELLPEPTKESVVPKTFYRKLTKAEIKQKVNHALELVNLADYGHRDVMSLSGGQQQRIAIARAIVCEPKVLLLDEPLGALDLKMRKEMQIELKSMHDNLGITFIYVTHDQEEALTMSDVIVVMNDGVIQQIGTPKKIYDEPANAFVASFIGESNILSGVMEKDYTISFLGKTIDCVDKGFAKNEKVDIVIRPEDIKLYPADSEKGQFDGEVLTSVFKGTYYEMEIRAGDYEFTVQSTKEFKPEQKVRLKVEPDSIHIMKKLRTVNKFVGEMTGNGSVWMCEGEFDTQPTEFEKGDKVNVFVPFDAVELTDDESDGTIGGNVAQSLYKGTYYQVQVYTDTDEDFYIDTTDEWDIGDRVGIKLNPAKITLERAEEENEA